MRARTTMPSVDALVARLGNVPIFRELDDKAMRIIAKSVEFRSLRRGQVLWQQGSHAYELAYVWGGQLNVLRTLEGRVNYRAVKMNDVIGFSNAIGRAVCSVDVVAAEPSRIVIVPGDVLRGLVPRYPEIAFRALEHMGALVARL